jgi:acylphosphatase
MTPNLEASSASGPEESAVASYNLDEGDLLLRVSGILPAAEFHPFVLGVARRLGLRGWIRHDAGAAIIRAIGFESQLVQLVRAIRDDAPPSTSIRGMDPDLITADTPPVGERFVALIEDNVELHNPTPTEPPLAHVA